MTPVVFKLGGSLLSLGDLVERSGRVLAQRAEARVAFVVGGGSAVDLVREWDRLHRIGEEAAHQFALRAMRLNAELVARLLPPARVVASPSELAAAWSEGALPLLDAGAWLSAAEAAGRTTVPHTWQSTSDSIAAWLAAEMLATELVLLKSAPHPVGSIQQAADNGLVDECFPDAAALVRRVSWVNLRTDDCRIEQWICVPLH